MAVSSWVPLVIITSLRASFGMICSNMKSADMGPQYDWSVPGPRWLALWESIGGHIQAPKAHTSTEELPASATAATTISSLDFVSYRFIDLQHSLVT